MSFRSLLVLLPLSLLATALLPDASAAVPVGHCVDTDHTNCDGLVCVWDGALKACVPRHLPAPTVGACNEVARDCPPGGLACAIVNGAYYCVLDICYDAPEWCDIGVSVHADATPDEAAILDAPVCGTLVGVRCADNGAFCWVYVNAAVHQCVQLQGGIASPAASAAA
jgi:hypothetical protein